jgi:hypothetical protein
MLLSLFQIAAAAADPPNASALDAVGPGVANSSPPALTVCASSGRGSEEGSPIAGATIILITPDGHALAGTAGTDGCTVFDVLAAGNYRVTVTAPGTVPVDGAVAVTAEGDARFRARLALAAAEGQDVLIEADREQPGETRRSISPTEVRNLPGAANDALKSVQAMPGVARAPYGAGMLVVRGAAPGDTQVLLDGQPIPQLYHFGGLRSIFPTEALERIDFLPGGFGVRYGRAIGGVVDVQSRGARDDKWGGFADADLYDASALAEGPIGKDARNGRVMASLRRSYVDALLPLAPAGNLGFTVAPRYYDYQIRYDMVPAENGTQARLMAYGSDDALDFVVKKADSNGLRGRYLYRTAFHRVQAPIVKPIAGGWLLSLDPSMGYQDLTLDGGGVFALEGTRTSGGLRAEARGPLGLLGPDHKMNLLFGVDGQVQRDAYDVNYADDGNSGATTPDRRQIAKAAYGSLGAGAFAEAEIDIGHGVTAVPGIRADVYAPSNQISFDPRFAMRWRVSSANFVKGYAGVYHQPPEFYQWDPKLGNPALLPSRAIQTGLGGGRRFSESMTAEGEVFYKWLDRLPVQAPGDPGDPTMRTRWTGEGIGRVFGIEALLKRDISEKTFGWISYTLSKSERASPYSGGWNAFSMDQTHIFGAVLGRSLTRGWAVGGRFQYVTGNPTMVVNEAVFNADSDQYMPVPGFRHTARLPAFHELDVRIDKRWEWSKWTLNAYLDVQNVYAHANPEQVRYSFDYSQHAYVTSVPVFPSIGLRGEF